MNLSLRTSAAARLGSRAAGAFLCLLLLGSTCDAETLRVPGFTAYLDPNPDGARISARNGVTGWRDPGITRRAAGIAVILGCR